MVLFRCCTFFQLMNAIQIKLALLQNEEVDLILNSSTDFSGIIDNLTNSGIFKNVSIMPDTIEDNRSFRTLNVNDKTEWSRSPGKYIHKAAINGNYTDYYISVEDEYNKLVYYYLIEKGMNPKVHLFDESKSTYSMDIIRRAADDGIDHKYYGSKAFMKNLCEVLLYEPSLYIGPELNCPINSIPKINYKDESVRNKFNSVFGYNKLPDEKYIFLEEPYFWDKFPTNDIDLLDMLAEIVGKENIVVKMHPRNQIDRFTPRGYKLVSQSKIPWEMTIMNSDLSDKVLVTIASNAAISAKLVFDAPATMIQLYEMLLIGKDTLIKRFGKFDNLIIDYFNSSAKCLFRPRSKNELIEVLKYVDGRNKIGR